VVGGAVLPLLTGHSAGRSGTWSQCHLYGWRTNPRAGLLRRSSAPSMTPSSMMSCGVEAGAAVVNFALANLDTESGERAALAIDGAYFRLDRMSSGYSLSVRAILDEWEEAYPKLLAAADECASLGSGSSAFVSPADAKLLTPIRYPNKLVCVGGVYRDHLLEFNLPPQRWKNMPMFLRAPTTSIVGPGRTLVIPATTRQLDWEIELAVIVSRRLKSADLDTAAAAIAGYSVGLDMTCRDLLDRDSPTGVDLVRAKAQDGMAPVGPFIRPSAFIRDVHNLRLKLFVNGEIKQNGCTTDMLYSVPEQLSTISRYITLEPGDIVFTGSPAGSGASIGQYLQPGDQILAEIEGVGRLDVEVVAPVS
jgi:2-keto-4-pentenoate hydratase/2-oxohepta-3-ene-1,7-dioic acid hydratase in catechol pathway